MRVAMLDMLLGPIRSWQGRQRRVDRSILERACANDLPPTVLFTHSVASKIA